MHAHAHLHTCMHTTQHAHIYIYMYTHAHAHAHACCFSNMLRKRTPLSMLFFKHTPQEEVTQLEGLTAYCCCRGHMFIMQAQPCSRLSLSAGSAVHIRFPSTYSISISLSGSVGVSTSNSMSSSLGPMKAATFSMTPWATKKSPGLSLRRMVRS